MQLKPKKKDNITGGIAKFINTNKRKDKTKEIFNKKYNKDYYKIRKKYKEELNRLDYTKRVILPQKNKEKVPPKKMIILTEAGKNLRRLGEGSYLSLMIRTPQSFPIKEGRKRISQSFDCGNKPDSVIFNDFDTGECQKDNSRLFGGGKKLRTKFFNIESSKISPYKFGRKHFFGKMTNSKIF